MWQELIGISSYAAGASGTATIPAGAIVTCIRVHSTAGGSFTIFGGASIPVIANDSFVIQFNHTGYQSGNNSSVAGSQNIVFTTTDSFVVFYTKPGHTSSP